MVEKNTNNLLREIEECKIWGTNLAARVEFKLIYK